MEHDSEFDTTVLTDGYDEFQDTVVDQVIAFDPSLFQGSSGDMAQQAQRPTWVSAGSSATPAQQPQQPLQPQQPATRPVWSRPDPQWVSSETGQAVAPSQFNPDEDTWVLGTSQPTARSAGSTAADTMAAPAGTFAQAPAYTRKRQAPSATWQAPAQATRTMMAATDSKPDPTNLLLVGIIIGLAVVGIVAIVVVIAIALVPQSSSSPASAPVVAAAPSSSSSAASEQAVAPEPEPQPQPEADKSSESSHKQGIGSSTIVAEGGGRALSETETYNMLSELYALAGEYDAGVRTCADDFNNNYLKEDKGARSSKASQVTSLKAKIKSSWDEAKEMELPFMSKNTDAHRDICELYECLYRRIDVIDQAWKIDLTYEKPKDHQDEIVAPLRAQQVNGADKYFTRFKELYPNVSLVKP